MIYKEANGLPFPIKAAIPRLACHASAPANCSRVLHAPKDSCVHTRRTPSWPATCPMPPHRHIPSTGPSKPGSGSSPITEAVSPVTMEMAMAPSRPAADQRTLWKCNRNSNNSSIQATTITSSNSSTRPNPSQLITLTPSITTPPYR